MLPRVQQVIQQTRTRIFGGETRAEGKILSLFGPSKDQWVYNKPDVDASKVVWAWEMDAANNRGLMQYYPDRNAWLVNMNTEPATVSPYLLPALSTNCHALNRRRVSLMERIIVQEFKA